MPPGPPHPAAMCLSLPRGYCAPSPRHVFRGRSRLAPLASRSDRNLLMYCRFSRRDGAGRGGADAVTERAHTYALSSETISPLHVKSICVSLTTSEDTVYTPSKKERHVLESSAGRSLCYITILCYTLSSISKRYGKKSIGIFFSYQIDNDS